MAARIVQMASLPPIKQVNSEPYNLVQNEIRYWLEWPNQMEIDKAFSDKNAILVFAF